MSGGLLEAREDGGSPGVDSKTPGADGERNRANKIGYVELRNRANKIGCGELRKEPSERVRGWGTSTGYGRIQGGSRGWRSKGSGQWEEIG